MSGLVTRTKVSRFDEIEVRELTAEELTMKLDKANGYFGFDCSACHARFAVWDDPGGGAKPFDHGHGALRAGEIVEVITGGSGGYGPPSERDPDAVRRDIAEGAITPDAARAVYNQAFVNA